MIRADMNTAISLDKSFHNSYAIEAVASSTIQKIAEITAYKGPVNLQVTGDFNTISFCFYFLCFNYFTIH